MAANFSKSLLLLDINGYRSKCGMTLASKLARSRTSYLSVLSLRSGRSPPHPKYSRMAARTSARSAFWLTEKLGLTSHPVRNFMRGENETVKQPSPSTYPDMYEEMSISLAGVLAASTLAV